MNGALADQLRASEDLPAIAAALCAELARAGEGAPRVLRLGIHRRPSRFGSAYDAIAVASGRDATGLPSAGRLATSLSLWAALRVAQGPVLLEVDPPRFLALPGLAPLGAAPGASLVEGASRVTHTIAIPIRRPTLEGMVTLEVVHRGDPAALAALGARAAEHVELATDAILQRVGARSGEPRLGLPVAPAPTFASALRLLSRMAEIDETILLCGPSGVGKSTLAAGCHQASPRGRGPFVSVNLLSVAEGLRSAELFGWRRGAATGLTADNPGRVAAAEGGTLFIDEIDKLGLPDQRALLEFLENRSYRRLGDPRLHRADVRVIVASNADLAGLAADGAFLPDLLWRLVTFPVRVPPLCERREEIAPWARWFLDDLIRRHGDGPGLGMDAIIELQRADWPGNLRELRAVVARAWLIARMRQADEITRAEVQEARSMGPSVEGGRPVTGGLRQLAAALLDAEARRSSGRFWELCDGALRAAVVVEALARPPAQRPPVVEVLTENRNQARALRAATELLEALADWEAQAGQG